jgi:hypothetical protein
VSLDESTQVELDTDAPIPDRLKALMLLRDAAALLGEDHVYVIAVVTQGEREIIMGQRGEAVAALLDAIRQAI